MDYVDIARQTIIRHEGKRNKPYKCTEGYLTIGVGRNLDANGLSDDEILYLLENDIHTFNTALLTKLPWVGSLDSVRQAVLLDMAFNLGINGLLAFKNTLDAVKRGDYEAAAEGMLNSKWARQVKDRATTLAEMMRTGKLPEWIKE